MKSKSQRFTHAYGRAVHAPRVRVYAKRSDKQSHGPSLGGYQIATDPLQGTYLDKSIRFSPVQDVETPVYGVVSRVDLPDSSEWADLFQSGTIIYRPLDAVKLTADRVRLPSHLAPRRKLRLAGEDPSDDAVKPAVSYVESPLPEAPEATGTLVIDVRNFTGLSNTDLAALLNVEDETVLAWRDHEDEIPDATRSVLEVLRAIGMTLVGGLGPAGVKRWLTIGSNPPLRRLKEGQIQQVKADALGFLDSPAT